MNPSEPRSFRSDPVAASEVQGQRRSPAAACRHAQEHPTRAPDGRWPLLVAIRANPRSLRPTELPMHVPKRPLQPLVRPRGRQRGPGPLSVPAQLTWRTATPPPPALEGQLLVAIGAKPHEANPTELHVTVPKPGALVSTVLKGRQRVPSPLPVPRVAGRGGGRVGHEPRTPRYGRSHWKARCSLPSGPNLQRHTPPSCPLPRRGGAPADDHDREPPARARPTFGRPLGC